MCSEHEKLIWQLRFPRFRESPEATAVRNRWVWNSDIGLSASVVHIVTSYCRIGVLQQCMSKCRDVYRVYVQFTTYASLDETVQRSGRFFQLAPLILQISKGEECDIRISRFLRHSISTFWTRSRVFSREDDRWERRKESERQTGRFYWETWELLRDSHSETTPFFLIPWFVSTPHLCEKWPLHRLSHRRNSPGDFLRMITSRQSYYKKAGRMSETKYNIYRFPDVEGREK